MDPYGQRAMKLTRPIIFTRLASAIPVVMLLVCPAAAQDTDVPGKTEKNDTAVGGYRPSVPEDLLGDEHLREEFGINSFTTPSIKELFADLEGLGRLPYGKTKREIPRSVPVDRAVLAIQLGTLIADGFLVVTCEKVDALEEVGRSVLKHAKVLGAGNRVTRHAQSLMENSMTGDWRMLKDELAATQADVEAEMVLLRDVDMAHLIALGGWLRAFEISTVAAGSPYSEQKAQKLGRVDVVEYFLSSLESLAPEITGGKEIVAIREGLTELRDLIDVPEGKAFTVEELPVLEKKARSLMAVVTLNSK